MIARAPHELAAACGGTLAAPGAGVPARGASIDTRTLEPGDVFFAVVGGTRDGHDFVAAAAERGAAAVVVSRDVPAPSNVAVVRVADATEALGRLAADERERRALRVVGVTGSAGKTTTRALAVAALAARFRVGGTSGNLNNQWGLPLSLLRLEDGVEAAALEMGMNHAGEIARLARIARPDVGVVTNVGTAHIGFLGSKEAIAAAKAELLEELPDDGAAVVDAASPELAPHLARLRCKVVRFGLEPGADLVAERLEGDIVRGASFVVAGTHVRLALWGRHAALNALAALGAARAAGVPIAEAAPRLAAVEQQPGRGRVLRLFRGVALIDEIYNANPGAMEAVLAEVAKASWNGRRFAVLGDMFELGEFAPELHRAVGRAAARAGIGLLWAVGPLAAETVRGAAEAGLADARVFPDAEAAAAEIGKALRDDDLLLIKGSRGVALELVRDAAEAALGGRQGE